MLPSAVAALACQGAARLVAVSLMELLTLHSLLLVDAACYWVSAACCLTESDHYSFASDFACGQVACPSCHMQLQG